MLQQLQGELWGVDTFQLATWGDIKTCKTTLGLTFPKPLVLLDLDRGFHRARQRFTQYRILELKLGEELTNIHLDSGAEIIVVPYQMPIVFPGQRNPESLLLWNKMIQDVYVACYHPNVKTINYDTGSVLWLLSRSAHLERVQTENQSRQTLGQFEYNKPNTEMRALLTMPKAWGKNLVIEHHMAGKYEDVQKGNSLTTEKIQVGYTWEGWNRIGAIVDVIGQTYIARSSDGPPTPSLRLETCGLTLAAEGEIITNPTYESVLSKIIAERLAEAGSS